MARVKRRERFYCADKEDQRKWSKSADSNINNDASSSMTHINAVMLDITNTSTHKVKFAVTSETQIALSTTYVQFLKFGET